MKKMFADKVLKGGNPDFNLLKKEEEIEEEEIIDKKEKVAKKLKKLK